MSISRTLCLVYLVLTTSLLLHAQSVEQSTKTGKLSGLILDSGKARVPEAKIIVEREGFRREMISADDGAYEIELPAARYTVTAVRRDFYPTIKSDVEIRPDTVTNLNVILKGIVFREGFVPLEELRTETMVPNTTIQVKKLHDKPRELQLPAPNKRLERTRQ